jgi:hypothetical protein
MHQNTERKTNSYNEYYLQLKITVYFNVIKTMLYVENFTTAIILYNR